MWREVAIAMSYNNGFMLCIISITRIATKKSSKVVGPAIKSSIHTESCNYWCYDKWDCPKVKE